MSIANKDDINIYASLNRLCEITGENINDFKPNNNYFEVGTDYSLSDGYLVQHDGITWFRTKYPHLKPVKAS